MKSSTSINRSLVSILALASAAIFSMSGIAHAQSGDDTSRQGSSAGQTGQSGSTGGTQKTPDGEPFPYDILEEPVDTGYVDQEKREGRAKDPRSPSPEDHVPEFPVDKEGKPVKDPMYEQGGPIGPN